jgi:hypothetical protein
VKKNSSLKVQVTFGHLGHRDVKRDYSKLLINANLGCVRSTSRVSCDPQKQRQPATDDEG